MKPIAHKYLAEIDNYIPGKSAIDGKKAVKLSSNENALGASPLAIEAYKKHASDLFRYADGSCALLREKIAERNGIHPSRIVCGAGSDEVLALLAASFAGVGDEIIYTEHGFLMYPISSKRVGAIPVKVREKGLKADIEAITKAVSDKTKIIFIANPNNPTGSYLNKSEIDKLINSVPKNVLIVLDHAYDEFVSEIDYPDAIDLVNKNANVVVTRTFSKIYGLASLRIGWCYSSTEIAEILNKVRGPFNVGGPAQFAAIAALGDEEFLVKSKAHNQKWREIFFKELDSLSHLMLHPSVGNFILLDFFDAEKCVRINNVLIEHGFVLREMSAYGLPQCLRMTIGNETENSQIISILRNNGTF